MATSKREYAWKLAFLSLGCALIVALLAVSVLGLPIGSCSPSSCPEGYMDGGLSCADGICTRTCVTGECGGEYTTVYTHSEVLDDYDERSYYKEDLSIDFGDFTPTDTTKCYRFRQTTPYDFIDGSDISGYEDTSDFDSAIALFWASSASDRWYDHNPYYYDGEEGILSPGSGSVWIDSCGDNGDNFGRADRLSNTNYLYCAPNQNACNAFNGENCDTDCYGHRTELSMEISANVEDDFDCNSFVDYRRKESGDDEGKPVIRYISFDKQTVGIHVDEYALVNVQNDNQQCEYWPQCNPADPCCTSDGHFRPSGYTCKSAHNAQCLTANSAGCGGVAYEDRCTGTSSECPDNNFEIDFDEACNGLSCVEQSCSGWTLQPQRTCSTGACQQQVPYACQNNLNCLNSSSCKASASSQNDCGDGAVYDPEAKVCYVNGNQTVYNLKYDKNGNLLSGLGLDYAYNSFNRLVSVKDTATGELKEEYTYDHNGDRRKKVTHNSDGTTTTVYYANGNFIQTVNSSGVYNETYYYFNGNLVGKRDSDKSMLFFHPDHLGSTRLITDSASNVVADLSYKPFGEIIDNTNERFLYTGKELDTSGNYYLGARYLDPAPLYTFTQPDQNIPNIYNPQDLNRYTYARNNPYTYTDPNGESPTIALGIAGALIGASIDLGIQLWNNGGDFKSVNYDSVAVSAVTGFVSGATLGAGTALLGASRAATIASSAISGVAAGQTAVAGNNRLEGSPVTEGLLQPQDILRDSIIGGVSGGVGKFIGRLFPFSHWGSVRGKATVLPRKSLDDFRYWGGTSRGTGLTSLDGPWGTTTLKTTDPFRAKGELLLPGGPPALRTGRSFGPGSVLEIGTNYDDTAWQVRYLGGTPPQYGEPVEMLSQRIP